MNSPADDNSIEKQLPPWGSWDLPSDEELKAYGLSINALLYGVHVSFEDGVEECLIQPAAPSS
jgi:hypothetical protein